ncbi:MAG TPA: hypothetical protein P5089_02505 [Candidatus Portnoybacteria bacterium]|nr:hypothetical protein [Candidatus Portnoybacteria bacterium]
MTAWQNIKIHIYFFQLFLYRQIAIKKEGKMLERLSDVYIGRLFNKFKIGRCLSGLSKIPSTNKFCVIKIKTYAQPSLEKREPIIVAPQTSWLAAEKALDILNKEATLFSWCFFIPIKSADSSGCSFYKQKIHIKAGAVVDDFFSFVEKDKRPVLNDQGNIDAKIYLSSCDNNACSSEICMFNCIYINWLYWPEFYALGMRI